MLLDLKMKSFITILGLSSIRKWAKNCLIEPGVLNSVIEIVEKKEQFILVEFIQFFNKSTKFQVNQWTKEKKLLHHHLTKCIFFRIFASTNQMNKLSALIKQLQVVMDRGVIRMWKQPIFKIMLCLCLKLLFQT